MQSSTYCFTVIDRDSNEILCEDLTDVLKLKEFLPEAMYDYIYPKVMGERLGAKKFIQFNRICLVRERSKSLCATETTSVTSD